MPPLSFQGPWGILQLILTLLFALFVAIVLPSMLLTAGCNALFFETLHWLPEINLWQGGLLWGGCVILLFLVLDIDIKLLMGNEEELMSQLDADEQIHLFGKEAPSTEPKESQQYSEHWHKWRQQQQEASEAKPTVKQK